jgi:hypothetical protein
MPKATIKLPDGTSVVIDGSPEEVAKLLALYGGATSEAAASSVDSIKKPKRKQVAPKNKVATSKKAESGDSPDLPAIIKTIKNCDWAESIETKVLDKVGQVNRILLPLFIVHEYMDNAYALTSGEVSQITTDLGIPVQTPNVSRTLSGTASKYVIGDKVRKQGQAVRYKLSRRGVQYFKGLLEVNSPVTSLS